MSHILLVDDDENLHVLLKKYLNLQGFVVDAVENGAAMDVFLTENPVDLIILDLMLPGEDGLSIAKRLAASRKYPVIMLSACGEDIDRIIGLEVGADDYLAKPFNPRELLARIRAVLRRQQPADSMQRRSLDILSFGCFELDLAKHSLQNNGDPVALTNGEYRLLRVFFENPNRVLNRDTLLEMLKGFERSPYDRSIDVRIMRLRQKIEPDANHPSYIRTIWGEGYMFVPPESEK